MDGWTMLVRLSRRARPGWSSTVTSCLEVRWFYTMLDLANLVTLHRRLFLNGLIMYAMISTHLNLVQRKKNNIVTGPVLSLRLRFGMLMSQQHRQSKTGPHNLDNGAKDVRICASQGERIECVCLWCVCVAILRRSISPRQSCVYQLAPLAALCLTALLRVILCPCSVPRPGSVLFLCRCPLLAVAAIFPMPDDVNHWQIG